MWNLIHEENDIKKIIKLDVQRTYQAFNIFKTDEIKKMMLNILFIWSKNNPDVSYKQGMNELLAVIILSIIPYYISESQSYSTAHLITEVKQILNQKPSEIKLSTIEILYDYLFNLKDMESDFYYLFDILMKRGTRDIYYVPNEKLMKNNSPLSKVNFLIMIEN
jgi:TBC1 domain family protein 5